MTIGRQEFMALFLDLANEAAVVAHTLDDPALYDMAVAAALAAGQRIGLSDAQVLAMQQDMFETRMGGPTGTRVVPDLEGPATAREAAKAQRARTSDPETVRRLSELN
jgi:hypothetical protein